MASFYKNIKLKGDIVIWLILFFLLAISLLEVYSSIGKFAYDKQGGNTTRLFFKHFLIVILSLGTIFAVSNIKYTRFSLFAKLGFYISIPLILATTFLGLASGKAAARWVDIPIIGSFQPSEMIKFIVIVYLARMITLNKDTIKTLPTFRKLLIAPAIVSIIIFPENFSTSALLFFVCVVLMFIGGVKFKYWITLVIAGVMGLGIFFAVTSNTDIKIGRSETWEKRITEYRGKDKDAITQTNIAKMAIASGYPIGKGPGNTIQGRLLSESHNDFIYSIIIEELGIIGGIAILLLYLMFFFRCMRIAFKAEGQFAALTAIGLGLAITIQALVNMGVAVNLLPVTGQTLPFISYGGTSFLFSSVAIGIILSISAEVQKDENQEQINEIEELMKESAS